MMRAVRSIAEVFVGFVLSTVLTFLAVTAAVAIGGGAQNGEDLSCCGWIGHDNPDFVTGSYAYSSYQHDLVLSEWNEPGGDVVRNLDMDWTYEAAVTLNNETNQRALEYEIRIRDETYYDGVAENFNTNLPWSKAPTVGSWPEELRDGHTEIELEQWDPYRIHNAVVYYWHQQVDSEKPAVSGAPTFYSEVEWCAKPNWDPCRIDVTGWMRKVVLQQ